MADTVYDSLTTSFREIFYKTFTKTSSGSTETITFRVYARVLSSDVATKKSVVQTYATYSSGTRWYTFSDVNHTISLTGCTTIKESYSTTSMGIGTKQIIPASSGSYGSTTVSHNADGSASVTISMSFTSSYSAMSWSGSKTVSLPALKLGATIGDFTGSSLGGQLSATYTVNADGYFYSLRITESDDTLIERFNGYSSGTNVTLSASSVSAVINRHKTDQAVSIRAYIDTYTDSAYSNLLTSSSTKTLNLAVGEPPTIGTCTVTESNASVKKLYSSGITIQNLSVKTVSVSATAKSPSTIASVTVSNGGETVSLNLSGGTYSGNISGPASGVYTITVTDSRGLSTSKTITEQYLTYENPTVSEVTIVRTGGNSSTATLTAKGTYSAAASNVVTVGIQIAGSPTSSIENATTNATNHTWTVTKQITDVSYTERYIFYVVASDGLGNASDVVQRVLNRSNPFIWLGKTTMKIYGHFIASGNIRASAYYIGDSEIPTIIERGTSGIWTYEKWSNGKYECWGSVTDTTTAVGNSWNNEYIITLTQPQYPEGAFIEAPVYTYSLDSNYTCWLAIKSSADSDAATKEHPHALYVARPTSYGTTSNSKTFTVSYHAIGKWK